MQHQVIVIGISLEKTLGLFRDPVADGDHEECGHITSLFARFVVVSNTEMRWRLLAGEIERHDILTSFHENRITLAVATEVTISDLRLQQALFKGARFETFVEWSDFASCQLGVLFGTGTGGTPVSPATPEESLLVDIGEELGRVDIDDVAQTIKGWLRNRLTSIDIDVFHTRLHTRFTILRRCYGSG